jgi:adenosylhomocysteine nucleosidase
MRKIVIVAALESEFLRPGDVNAKIFYTGIGKINAARATTQLIFEEKPDLILNVGTAGCFLQESLGEVFGVSEVLERDMIAEPLAPRGTVPFSDQPPLYTSGFGSVRCATGDSFVTSQEQWLIDNAVALVDMELFAIAKVANHFGIEWKSIKFASDLSNSTAHFDWLRNLKDSTRKILSMIDDAIS